MTELSLMLVVVFTFTAYFVNSVLQLAIVLLGLSLSCGIHVSMLSSKWLMYAIFLVFLGGMMVVFIYSTVLAGNNMQILSTGRVLVPVGLLSGALIFLTQMNQMYLMLVFNSLYSAKSLMYSMALIAILLFALFIIVKIVENFKGALIKQFV